MNAWGIKEFKNNNLLKSALRIKALASLLSQGGLSTSWNSFMAQRNVDNLAFKAVNSMD